MRRDREGSRVEVEDDLAQGRWRKVQVKVLYQAYWLSADEGTGGIRSSSCVGSIRSMGF